MTNEAEKPEATTDQAAPVGALVGRDEVKNMLDDQITDAINGLIGDHQLHPQEAAEVLVDQARRALNALAWKPEYVRMAERNLEEAERHLAY